MVKPVMTSVKLKVVQYALMLLAPSLASAGYSEQLLDPTRPPDSLGSAQPSTAGASSGPVLQSVLISPQRRLAIISGKTVKLGEKFGTASVVSISESEVVLKNGNELKTLKLFPDVQKRLTASGVSSNTDRRR